jgi:hypothetical protein
MVRSFLRGKYQLAFEGAGFVAIEGDVALLISRNFSIHINGVNWADRLASAALNALIRVDVELVLTIKLINTVNWANAYAGFVFYADARFCNNEWHGVDLQFSIILLIL